MKILFTRSTEPHQLDIKLFSDKDNAPGVWDFSQAGQSDPKAGTLTYHSSLEHSAKPDSERKKYRQLLIGK